MSALDYYKVFYYAASTGSITKAAQTLFITQPSASYAIKQLEEQLGVRLLLRKAKGVELTGEGAALYEYVQQSYKLLQAGERKIAEMKEFRTGIVRLGASDSLCKVYLLPFLEKFRQQHPGIRIVLTHGRSEEISARLSAGSIDCGIVYLPTSESGLLVHAVKSLQDRFLAAPAYAQGIRASQSEGTLAGLLRHPFILLSEMSRSRAFLHAFLQTHGLAVTPDIEVGSIDLLLEFVRKGMGIAFTATRFAADDLTAGTLIELPVAEPIPSRSIGVITRSGPNLSLAAAQFVSELSEQFGSS